MRPMIWPFARSDRGSGLAVGHQSGEILEFPRHAGHGLGFHALVAVEDILAEFGYSRPAAWLPPVAVSTRGVLKDWFMVSTSNHARR